MRTFFRKTKAVFFFLGYFFIFIICQQSYHNSRIPSTIPEYEKSKSKTYNLQKWGYSMHYSSIKYQIENPELKTDFDPACGIVGNINLAIRYPWNLVQGAVEASIFWLILTLGLILEKSINSIFKMKFPIFIVLPILFLLFISTSYIDYKYFNIELERGFYYPIWIILFFPVWQAVKNNWHDKKIPSENIYTKQMS